MPGDDDADKDDDANMMMILIRRRTEMLYYLDELCSKESPLCSLWKKYVGVTRVPVDRM